jgi:hypothetical protein
MQLVFTNNYSFHYIAPGSSWRSSWEAKSWRVNRILPLTSGGKSGWVSDKPTKSAYWESESLNFEGRGTTCPVHGWESCPKTRKLVTNKNFTFICKEVIYIIQFSGADSSSFRTQLNFGRVMWIGFMTELDFGGWERERVRMRRFCMRGRRDGFSKDWLHEWRIPFLALCHLS